MRRYNLMNAIQNTQSIHEKVMGMNKTAKKNIFV